MPKAKVFNMAGKEIGEIELSEAIFGIEPNKSVLHDSVKNHLANCRQGTQSALTKGEVDFTTKKPWRQKGTGRARAGYAGSPVWYHGGVASRKNCQPEMSFLSIMGWSVLKLNRLRRQTSTAKS